MKHHEMFEANAGIIKEIAANYIKHCPQVSIWDSGNRHQNMFDCFCSEKEIFDTILNLDIF